MLGKEKCRILKEIRRRIAEENDIPVVTRECRHQGECRGTCPRCEQELRELERQLALRQSLGKRVAVTALCAGLALSSAGCSRADGLRAASRTTSTPAVVDLMGDVPWVEPTPEPELPGEPVEAGEIELEGYVAYSGDDDG